MPDDDVELTTEDRAVQAVQALLNQIHPNDRFRVLARVNASANTAALQYERDEFQLRRERYNRINRGLERLGS
jgi:hypothetical protein